MNQEKTMTLGRFIALQRRCLHMTQEELAGKLNVSKSAVAKWETDGGVPDRDNLKNLASIFKITVDELYGFYRENSNKTKRHTNITRDVIAILEAYGYTVIPPDEEAER